MKGKDTLIQGNVLINVFVNRKKKAYKNNVDGTGHLDQLIMAVVV